MSVFTWYGYCVGAAFTYGLALALNPDGQPTPGDIVAAAAWPIVLPILLGVCLGRLVR